MSRRSTLAVLPVCACALSAAGTPGEAGPGTRAIAPDARGVVAPDRTFDMLRLHLDVELRPEDRAVAGTATWTARRLAEGRLVLDGVALQVDRVELGTHPAPYRYDGRRLEIDLPAVAVDSEATVAVRYHATPRHGLNFREVGPGRYAEAWSHGEASDNRYWFPGWDHPNDRFAYEGVVRAPVGWTAVTNSGVDLVNYLVMVAAGPYEEIGTAPFTALVSRGTPRADVEATLAPTAAMSQHFQARTGLGYPWNRYRQVYVQRFLFTGMENTAATIMARWVLRHPSHGGTRGLRSESVTAHELAHQWFGDWPACRDWRELWLNEGFATYMADDWMAKAHGPWQAANDARRRRGSALGAESLAGRYFRPGQGDHHDVYEKGSTVLRMLEDVVGAGRFWAAIRAYVARGPGVVDTEDLRDAMEAASGQELGWFFQQWVELPTVPKLVVGTRVVSAAVRAAGRIVERLEPGAAERVARERVSRAVEILLDDLDERVRQGAVATLATMGDARSVAALERFVRVETRDPDADAARDAIAAIRARGPRDSPPNADAAKLEALEKRIEALERRLAEEGDRH